MISISSYSFMITVTAFLVSADQTDVTVVD